MVDKDGSTAESPSNKRRKPNLLVDKRKAIETYFMLRSKLTANRLAPERGTLSSAAKTFDISRQQANQLYQQGKPKYDATGSFNLTPVKPIGRPRKYDPDEMRDAIRNLECGEKTSLRSIADKIGLDVATLWCYKGWGDDTDDPIIRRHSNAVNALSGITSGPRYSLNVNSILFDDRIWTQVYEVCHCQQLTSAMAISNTTSLKICKDTSIRRTFPRHHL